VRVEGVGGLGRFLEPPLSGTKTAHSSHQRLAWTLVRGRVDDPRRAPCSQAEIIHGTVCTVAAVGREMVVDGCTDTALLDEADKTRRRANGTAHVPGSLAVEAAELHGSEGAVRPAVLSAGGWDGVVGRGQLGPRALGRGSPMAPYKSPTACSCCSSRR